VLGCLTKPFADFQSGHAGATYTITSNRANSRQLPLRAGLYCPYHIVTMASFSRGLSSFNILSLPPLTRICAQCLRRTQTLHALPRPQQRPRRLHSVSRSLSQQPKGSKLRVRNSPGTSTVSTSTSSQGSGDYAARLNSTLTVPTVIYEAPSHRALVLAASGLGTFFAGYGLLVAIHPGLGFIFGTPPAAPEDQILVFIPPILIAAGCILVGVGVWAFGAIRMLVKRITVLPQGSKGPLIAQLEVTRLAPWRKHEITVPITSLSLGRRVQHLAPASHNLADQYEGIEDAHVLLKPFLRVGTWPRTFFEETKNVFWRAPFATLAVSGHGRFTLDARGSAYKGSLGLDRLIPLNYKKAKFWDLIG
jgi:hypothetical protein